MKVINNIKIRLLITLKLFTLSINYLFRYLSKQTNKHMTRNQFDSICAMLFIYPQVALENERVVNALREGASPDEIEAILYEEF